MKIFNVLTIELQKYTNRIVFIKSYMTIIEILLSMIIQIEMGYIFLRLFVEKTQNNIFQGQQLWDGKDRILHRYDSVMD